DGVASIGGGGGAGSASATNSRFHHALFFGARRGLGLSGAAANVQVDMAVRGRPWQCEAKPCRIEYAAPSGARPDHQHHIGRCGISSERVVERRAMGHHDFDTHDANRRNLPRLYELRSRPALVVSEDRELILASTISDGVEGLRAQ